MAVGRHMKGLVPEDALRQVRQPGLRVRLRGGIADLAEGNLHVLLQVALRHGVVCIPDLPLTPGELHAFASRWGAIVRLPGGLAFSNQEPDLPSIVRVGNVRADGSIIPGARFGEYWHHDGDFWPPGQNFILNFWSSVRVPPTGGATGFLDTRAAYDVLGETERAELEDAHTVVRPAEIADFEGASADELPPDARHPVLLVHPVTREPALYLPESSSGIQRSDGRRLGDVASLVASLQHKVGIYEHRWAAGDLMIADNLQVMHRSMGGAGDQPRLLYRCQARIRQQGTVGPTGSA
jgi:taurine dioxygenase